MAAAADQQTDRWPGGALRATAVSRSYEGIRALQDVTLELNRHEVVGLIGPNGAGKTTLVNVMSGFDRPSAGTIELDGRDVTRWSPARRGRNGLARTFQHSRSFGCEPPRGSHCNVSRASAVRCCKDRCSTIWMRR